MVSFINQLRQEGARFEEAIIRGSLAGSGSLQFTTPFYSVTEDGQFAELQVLRRGGTFGVAGVDFTTYDGTAVDGQDYTGATNALISFPQGEVLQTIRIPIIDDNAQEDPETVYVGLGNPTGGADIGPIPIATLTIQSDDSSIVFANSVFSVGENVASGTAVINVYRTGSTNGTVPAMRSTSCALSPSM